MLSNADMASEVKSIQVIPSSSDLDDKVNKVAEKLRTSRSGLALLAVETIVNAIESGRAAVVNGEVLFIQSKGHKHSAA